MLITCRVGSQVTADIKLQVTRSKKGLREGWLWVPELSPSPALFRDYLTWREKGLWPAKWDEYKIRFLAEMKSPEAVGYINRITELVKSGYSIALACFCYDERFCHRSLLRNIIEEALQ